MLTEICAECSYAIFLKLASNNPSPVQCCTALHCAAHKVKTLRFSFYDFIQSQVRCESCESVINTAVQFRLHIQRTYLFLKGRDCLGISAGDWGWWGRMSLGDRVLAFRSRGGGMGFILLARL